MIISPARPACQPQPSNQVKQTRNVTCYDFVICLRESVTFGGSCYYIVLQQAPAHAHCDISYVQDLRSSAQAYQLPSQAQQNWAGNPSDLSTAYTVYPHTDMHNALDLRPAALPCCVPGAANASAVQTCAASKGLCCVTLAALGVNAVRQQWCSWFTQVVCDGEKL